MATEIASANQFSYNANMTTNMTTEQHSFKSTWTWAKNVKHDDGSIYTGYLDRYGKRTGTGTFRTPINSGHESTAYPIATWMEYKGEWRNDKPHGMGIARRYRGGTESFCVSTLIYKGIWANGEPVNDP